MARCQPNKAKNEEGSITIVNGWLERAQDSGGCLANSIPANKSLTGTEKLRQRLEAEHIQGGMTQLTQMEAFKIIYAIQANYPSFYAKQTDKQAEIMTNLWASAFKDCEYKVVSTALMVVMLKKKDFPPSIAEVNEEIAKMTKPMIERLDGETAWGEAWQLMNRYGYCLFEEQVAQREKDINDRGEPFADALQAVGGLDGIRMCRVDQTNTLRTQFIRIYNVYVNRENEKYLLPDCISDKVSAIKKRYVELLSESNILTRRALYEKDER